MGTDMQKREASAQLIFERLRDCYMYLDRSSKVGEQTCVSDVIDQEFVQMALELSKLLQSLADEYGVDRDVSAPAAVTSPAPMWHEPASPIESLAPSHPEMVQPTWSGDPTPAPLASTSPQVSYSPQETPTPLVAQSPLTAPVALVRPASPPPAPTLNQLNRIRLPNANAGRPYEARLGAFTGVTGSQIQVSRPWPPGLSLDAEGVLRGTPTQAGEHTTPWFGYGTLLGAQGVLQLTINPDPRSLWKDLPSDRSDPHWKPDADETAVSSDVAHVAVGSVRGRSHAHVGAFRDDDFALHAPAEGDPSGWHLLCVADGAGSAKLSRRGSQVACQTVIAKLRDMLISTPEGLAEELNTRSVDAMEQDKADAPFWTRTLYHVMGTAAAHAQAAIKQEADALGAMMRDLSTTLLVAIVRKTRAGAWFVGTYWVGDGAIGMWRQDWTAPKLFGEPESGEFAGQTTFLNSEDFSKADVVQGRLRYTLVDDFDYLALMTDGISDPKFPTEQLLKAAQPWADFTADLETVLADLRQGAPEAGKKLTEWMEFWSAGNHDDRTLLMLVPQRATRENT